MKLVSKDRRPAVWVIIYTVALVLIPIVVAWFFGELEGGYLGTGKLAPGFYPLAFQATPLIILAFLTLHLSVNVLFNTYRWTWLAVPLLLVVTLRAWSKLLEATCRAIGVC